MSEPLDMPDAPGWWAWEEDAHRGVSEIYEGYSKGLIVDEEPGGLEPDYYSGRKWYRLTMPWEQPQPAIPTDVREAIGAILPLATARNESYYSDKVDILLAWLDQQDGSHD